MNTLVYPITNRELLNYRRKMRRQRIIRRRVVLTLLAVFLTLIFTFSYNVIVTQANDDISEVSYKYYTYHQIEKGDSLWSIAEEYINYEFYDSIQDYIDEVMVINHLSDSMIKVGEELVIPYFSNQYY